MSFNHPELSMYRKITAALKRLFDNKVATGTAVVGAVVLGIFLFSSHGIVNGVSIAFENADLKKSIAEQKTIRDSLKKEIRTSRESVESLEKTARENYGMVKKGEKVYFIEEEKD